MYKGRCKKKRGGGEEHLVLKYVTILTPVFKIRNLAGKNARASIICYADCYLGLTFLTNAGERGKLEICFQVQNRQIAMNHKDKINWIANCFPPA